MRKGHENIIKKAQQRNFPEIYIKNLMASTATITELENLYFFLSQRLLWHSGTAEDFYIFDKINKKIFRKLNVYKYFVFGLAAALENQVISDILSLTDMPHIALHAMDIAVSNTITVQDAVALANDIDTESMLYELLTYPKYEKIYDLQIRKSVEIYPVDEKIKLAELYEQLKNNSELSFSVFLMYAKKYILEGKTRKQLRKLFDHKKTLQQKISSLSCCISSDNMKELPILASYEENLLNIVKEHNIQSKITLEINIPILLYYFSGYSLFLRFCFIQTISYDARDETFNFKTRNNSESEYVIFYDSLDIYKKKNGKLLPASLRNLQYSIRNYEEPAKKIFSIFFDMHIAQQEYIWKDIKKILFSEQICYMPIQLRELSGRIGINDLCHAKYKKDIPVTWNKGDINVSYLAYKAYPYIVEDDKNILIEKYRLINDPENVEHFFKFIQKYNINKNQLALPFYIIYYNLDKQSFWINEDGCPVSDNDVAHTVIDYLDLLLLLKRKIPLRFRSAKKLKVAHDEAAIAYTEKTGHIPVIKIQKNSQFHSLRKLLPDTFEWITTKKRIVLEGQIMHHCVSKYANLINKDQCAIYSFLDGKTKKRYTIEFRKQKSGNYYIRQIQGMCDRGAPTEVKEYIQTFIKGQQNDSSLE